MLRRWVPVWAWAVWAVAVVVAWVVVVVAVRLAKVVRVLPRWVAVASR